MKPGVPVETLSLMKYLIHLLINNTHISSLLKRKKMFFSAQWMKMRKDKWWRISESFTNRNHLTLKIFKNRASISCMSGSAWPRLQPGNAGHRPGRWPFPAAQPYEQMGHTEHPWWARGNRQNLGQLMCQWILFPQALYRCLTTWTFHRRNTRRPWQSPVLEQKILLKGGEILRQKYRRTEMQQQNTFGTRKKRHARTIGMLCGSPGPC